MAKPGTNPIEKPPTPVEKQQTNPIQSLLDKLSSAQERAAVDVDSMPYNVRGGWATAKRAAADEVDVLTAQVVRLTIPGRLGAAFLPLDTDEDVEATVGDHVAASGGIVFDAGSLYRSFLAGSQLPEAIRGKEAMRWGVDDFVRLVHTVEDFCGQEVSHPNLEYTPPPCEDLSREQALSIVRSTVEHSVGTDLVVVAARRHIFREVMDRRLANSMVPVLVTGADDRTMRSMEPLFRRKARVTPPGDFAGSVDEVLELISPVIAS
jgi:hypothetical protein